MGRGAVRAKCSSSQRQQPRYHGWGHRAGSVEPCVLTSEVRRSLKERYLIRVAPRESLSSLQGPYGRGREGFYLDGSLCSKARALNIRCSILPWEEGSWTRNVF